MKRLGYYECDKGSIVINGICISNGIGDGGYDIYYYDNEEDAKKDKFKNVCNDLWIDLRDTSIDIWTYDCDNQCEKINITKENINVNALQVYKDSNGNIALVKYF